MNASLMSLDLREHEDEMCPSHANAYSLVLASSKISNGRSEFVWNLVHVNKICISNKFDILDSIEQLKHPYKVISTKKWVPPLNFILSKHL